MRSCRLPATHPTDYSARSTLRAPAGRTRARSASRDQLHALVAYTLGPSGRLAHQKVFTRADVAVAVAPLLFGRHPSCLRLAVEAVCVHPDAIALFGVQAAREQAYAPACVIANETAIALKVAIQRDRGDAPALTVGAAEAIIVSKEHQLDGRPLTAGQKAMITGVATSGRGVELVLGVAGSGKTTALDAVRQLFETGGYRVVGTSISGQAARTLGRQAGFVQSRTVASLLWRLDHDQLHLDPHTVVVCDEAGMTDDPVVLRLLAAVEKTKAKLVMVGDDRQLGAIGPGGSLEALVGRHRGGVYVLAENVRQADLEERSMLAQLRAGSVDQAIGWYAEHDRIAIAPRRDEALDQTVKAWAADVAAGKDAAMLAWRRANVAALNQRAQAAMAAAGHLTGPRLQVERTTYQTGDRIVTLAPSPGGEVVTSQRGEITEVDPNTGTIAALMDDGHFHTFGPEQTGPEQLALGYATTVHRCQGATFDAAHLFADGGGRELAYVAMSRARDTAHVHVVADNFDQAIDDLAWDWNRERRQTWAIDTGTPETETQQHPLVIEADKQAPTSLRATLGRARLKAERAAVAAVGGHTDPHTRQQLRKLDLHIDALDQKLEPRRRPLPQEYAERSAAPTPEHRFGFEL